MPLDARQLRALEILDWLHDPRSRRSGRSIALAVALIRQACRNPGIPIQFFDHTNSPGGMRHIRQVIQDLLASDPRLSPFTIMTEQTLVLGIPHSYEDWLPTEEYFMGAEARTRGRAAGQRLAQQFGPGRVDEQAQGMRPADPQPQWRAVRPGGRVQDLLSLNQRVSELMAEITGHRPVPVARIHDPDELGVLSEEAAERHRQEAVRRELGSQGIAWPKEPPPPPEVPKKWTPWDGPRSAIDRILARDEEDD